MNKYGLYSVHSWKNMNIDVKTYIMGMFWDIDLLHYLTVLSLNIFSISKALPWNKVETTQKRLLLMKASSFGFCSELIAVCMSIYVHICVYICVSIYVYICTCVCRYVHRSGHADDASSQSLAFFPKTAVKTKHKLLHNASLKLKLDYQVGEIQ